jgi:AcrR family transcriptional regulator
LNFLTRYRAINYRLRDMSATRPYESPLRAEQLEQTRLRILEATTEVLADPASEEVTIPLVARRARVSLRTVYRHFATREVLFDAWADWVDERLQIHLHSYPESAEQLAAFARELYRSYDESESLVRAILTSRAARVVRERTRRSRQRAFNRAMRELTEGLELKERAQAVAVVYLLVSAPAWQAMREQSGLDGVEAGRAAAWALRVLTDELRRNPASLKEVDE